ncbi:MAG: glycoside hydrolase family 2 TIM barrel-domain containing protein [Clostridiales bacterium]|nr:glycoside hydrolase family 2 TIM barrel-domain containing protein [Clostridiales bacterium]
MANKINWNNGWKFSKEDKDMTIGSIINQGTWEDVTIPHTWNGIDGQDGGNDYYRGTCLYVKQLKKSELSEYEDVYLEFEGANSSADVYINGEKVGHHDGGYSTWRVKITENLKEENEITVAVDNAPNDYVYPQRADFTFYGGLYRNVSILCVPKARFDLDYFGSQAVKVTPIVEGSTANVEVETFLTGCSENEILTYTISDGESIIVEQTCKADQTTTNFTIENVHLWNGRKDPFLYTLNVTLSNENGVLDTRSIRFGCRTFKIDPDKGFFLNGESYPLRGVSRHQDRPEIGNALLPEHHEEDIDFIYELGATTIRLAHYQHDQYFYDLCDEKGFVLWAEIPYISEHLPKGRENTISQMKELIVQNYNHPSIFVWGLSNEITMAGASDADLIENHRILNDLAHEMDKTRLTTIAVVSMCPMEDEYVRIPDTVSYNHYFGWYGGDTSMNGPWMDEFHKKYPNQPIGMSEYGCEALNWHTSNPEQGDYTEEYQAYYHEELIKQLFTRPYIWATHVWNMYDFAADARAEGGENGMNHKGLMTFDRKYKKDAFFAYKAWLSDEPFVHIAGKRYVDRVEEVTKVTVYSNLPEVELFANGTSLGKQTSENHFFYFDVPNIGITRLEARAGECSDKSGIRKVEVFNEDYRMKETGDVLNWFEITTPDGYFSINDTLGAIMANPAGMEFFKGLMKDALASNDMMADMDLTQNAGMMQMLSGFTVKRMLSMLGTMGSDKKITKEDMLKMNAALNQIKR